jgi:hypothetical protein
LTAGTIRRFNGFPKSDLQEQTLTVVSICSPMNHKEICKKCLMRVFRGHSNPSKSTGELIGGSRMWKWTPHDGVMSSRSGEQLSLCKKCRYAVERAAIDACVRGGMNGASENSDEA